MTRPAPACPTPAEQFRLAVLAMVSRAMAALDSDSVAALRSGLPGLALYEDEAARRWSGMTAQQGEMTAIAAAHPSWPLQRLTGLPCPAPADVLIPLLMVEEDGDLARLVEPDGGFISTGGLIALHRLLAGPPGGDVGAMLATLDELTAMGVILTLDPDAPRSRRRYRVEPLFATALLGLEPRSPLLQLTRPARLPDPRQWQAHRDKDPHPDAQGALWKNAGGRAVIIRGPAQNGRKTWAGMAARAANRPLLHAGPTVPTDPARWQAASALAWLLDAVLMIEVQVPPGETLTLPAAACGPIALAVITGDSGAVHMPQGHSAHHLHFGLPDAAARAAHWRAAGMDPAMAGLNEMILSSGNIRRAARDAMMIAGMSAPDLAPGLNDVRKALRGLRDARLEALATPLDMADAPDPLFLDPESEEEFNAIVSRCRHRETLNGGGVRALFSGPSGTGKTLAARHVGRALGKDVYRIDLSATVNKYIGETEKALERAICAAEELDIVLLLDEGDALMARRTDVGNANDRYANLETSFLLQRIENFRGIILVTTNDADRIDAAFARRMDAVIAFGQPDELRREHILLQQLGKQSEASAALIAEIASRCGLSGGQLRNIAGHARLLALDAGRPIGDADLRRAVEREYRKAGANCPLRRPLCAVGS